jgi:hypothetical protein
MSGQAQSHKIGMFQQGAHKLFTIREGMSIRSRTAASDFRLLIRAGGFSGRAQGELSAFVIFRRLARFFKEHLSGTTIAVSWGCVHHPPNRMAGHDMFGLSWWIIPAR